MFRYSFNAWVAFFLSLGQVVYLGLHTRRNMKLFSINFLVALNKAIREEGGALIVGLVLIIGNLLIPILGFDNDLITPETYLSIDGILIILFGVFIALQESIRKGEERDKRAIFLISLSISVIIVIVGLKLIGVRVRI